jgi:hypothetical protein
MEGEEISNDGEGGAATMSVINLSLKHGKTLEVAQAQLEKAVEDVRTTLGTLVRRIDWTGDHRTVTLYGTGFHVEMWVDAQEVHAKGDLAFLGLLSGPLTSGLKGILQKSFPKQLT